MLRYNITIGPIGKSILHKTTCFFCFRFCVLVFIYGRLSTKSSTSIKYMLKKLRCVHCKSFENIQEQFSGFR